MTDRPSFPHDTEEARLDAELTRQELEETAQELANRLKDASQRIVFGAGVAFGFFLVLLLILRRITHRR